MSTAPCSPKRPLIIVCCHAIFTQTSDARRPPADMDPHNEAFWLLQPFQQSRTDPPKQGEHLTYMSHVALAHKIARDHAANGVEPVVIYSGGATQTSKTATSEAEGYAQIDRWLRAQSGDDADAPPPPTYAETNATDSLQNICFSILKYHSERRCWPDHITVVSHAFKQHRLLDLHLTAALRWPRAAARFAGLDPPFSHHERAAVERGEQTCCRDWARDLYGVRPPLSGKRQERGWVHGAVTHDDERVRRLLRWDGGDDAAAVYPDVLPWECQFALPG